MKYFLVILLPEAARVFLFKWETSSGGIFVSPVREQSDKERKFGRDVAQDTRDKK